MKRFSCSVLAVAALLVLSGVAVMAAPCAIEELVPCLPAMISGPTPTSLECCLKLKEQKPCLCSYLKEPQYRNYARTPNVFKVANHCGLSLLKC